MKRSYRVSSLGSAVSGAGSYSHRSPNISCGIELAAAAGRATALGVVMSIILSRFCEVIRRLIRTRLFFLYLSQQIVEQRARTKAVPRRIEPRVAECLFNGHEIMQRLLRSSNSARRLHSDRDTCCEIEIPNRLDHHLGVGERRAS